MTPATTAPTFVPDFAASVLLEDPELGPGDAVCVTMEPDWVTVKVGGLPVAIGPAVAAPTAGEVAVAPPCEDPPITDCTRAGTW